MMHMYNELAMVQKQNTLTKMQCYFAYVQETRTKAREK